MQTQTPSETRILTLTFLLTWLIFLLNLLPPKASRHKGAFPREVGKKMKETHKQVSQGAATGSLRSKSVLTKGLKQLGWLDPVGLCGLSWPAHWRLAKLSIQTEFMILVESLFSSKLIWFNFLHDRMQWCPQCLFLGTHGNVWFYTNSWTTWVHI